MEIPLTTERKTCRVCYSPQLLPLFSLGTQFVNDFPERPDKPGIQAPLEMVFCENCTLVQLKHTAPQELLYAGFYWYKSGVTETMKAALRNITKSAERFDLKPGDVVLDIGSNDGTMLRTYQVPGLITVGVEPAKNLSEEGKVGITHFINDFWTIQKYNEVVGRKAKIVTAIGMFYDMEDPNQFVKDAADALTDDGVFIAQLMCSKNMLDNNDVGNICVKPDTIILGDNKPIIDYYKGDYAIGKSGTLTRVKAKMKRQYKGNLIQIKPKYLDPIIVTPEHPIRIVKKKYFRNKCGQLRKKIGEFKLDWVPAKEVKRGDWVVMPKLAHGESIMEIDLTSFNRFAKSYRWGLLSFPLNLDTSWLLGLYVAEGHIGGTSRNPYVSFSLHTKEKHIANRIKSVFASLGYTTSVFFYNDRKTMEVRVTCAALARALPTWVGKGALNKHIPDFIMLAPKEVKKAFLRGLFEGDGYIKRNKVHLHTSSKILATQTQLLTASLGGMLGISYVKPYSRVIRGGEVKSKDSWQLRGSSKYLAKIFNFDHQGPNINHVIIKEKHVFVPVKNVCEEFFDGTVHNIETEDNSYLVSNAIVHNCHEHLEYYSFRSLEYLFNKNGLEVFDVEINDVNGKSYRLFAKKKGTPTPPMLPMGCEQRIAAVKEDEKDLATKQPYIDFYKRIEKQKNDCVKFINQELAKEKRIWVFGASTKGNVILQYYGLDHTTIGGASERSPWKFGKFTVGTSIPIVSEDEARQANPDYFLVLPYAFFNEMYEREKDWLRKGGKFIVPLPEFKVVEMNKNGERTEWSAREVLEKSSSKQTIPLPTAAYQTSSYPAKEDQASVSNVTQEPEKQSNGWRKKALIFGITGQDGSYLAELLLEKGYDVHGFIRRSATGNKDNIQHILDKITLHKGDLADPTSIYRTINEIRPHEIYNEADQDHVSWSWGSVGYSMDITGAAVGRILEIIRQVDPKIKYFQPVSSNMFGVAENPQTEETQFRPQSPYACGKVLAYVLCRYYRDVFGMFVSTGIFYNHESPRRTDEYVTRKVTKAAARISMGLQKKLFIGNLDAKIDWGYAKEFMEAAWNIMQLDKPDDFIICTGEAYSLREFVDETFRQVGLNADDYIEFDPRFARPGNTSALIGDYSKANNAFGFDPKVRFKEIIKIMLEHDLKESAKERKLKGEDTHVH